MTPTQPHDPNEITKEDEKRFYKKVFDTTDASTSKTFVYPVSKIVHDPIEGMMKWFDEEFFYIKDGQWGHHVDALDEDDNFMGKVNAYMVPNAIKDWLRSKLLEAKELGHVAGVKEAIEVVKKERFYDGMAYEINDKFLIQAVEMKQKACDNISSSLTKLIT